MSTAEFVELLGRRLNALGLSNSALGKRLYHGKSDKGAKVGRWVRGKQAPEPEEVRALARELHVNPIEVFIALGWLDEQALPVALRSVDTLHALAEGLTAFESSLPFMPISGGTIADAAAKNGNWAVVLIPKHHVVAVRSVDSSTTEIRLHLDDVVGLAPIGKNLDAQGMRRAVLTDFAGVLRRTGGMPEDDLGQIASLDAEHCPKSTQGMVWIRVPRLMAERAPSRAAYSLDPIRSIAIIGGHWGGQDDIAALLASLLGWGYVNTSFAAMNLFGRNMSNLSAEREDAQMVHDYNAALVARTLDGMTGFADQRVWAHGCPGSIVEVAELLADSRADQFVIYLKPNRECNRLAEEATSNPARPDSVDAVVADRAGDLASEILDRRIRVGNAVEIEVDERVYVEGFSYFVKQLRTVCGLTPLRLTWRNEEPRDPTIGKLVRAEEIL